MSIKVHDLTAPIPKAQGITTRNEIANEIRDLRRDIRAVAQQTEGEVQEVFEQQKAESPYIQDRRGQTEVAIKGSLEESSWRKVELSPDRELVQYNMKKLDIL